MKKELISIADLQARYHADFETGQLFNSATGREIGYKDEVGEDTFYKRVNIDGRGYYVHRVIFALAYGAWPDIIDHIDGNSLNNKLTNLRSGSTSTNMRNRGRARTESKLGRGVTINRDKNGTPRYYRSQIMINGETCQKDFKIDDEAALLHCQLYTINKYHKAGFPNRHFESLKSAILENPQYQTFCDKLASDEYQILNGDLN
ncbi:HNH endonuclease signature motif containing protein [Cereibacter changlensis]|uniref:HNH endonuclease signature motif containing protein n=1 Tax=Cereibacter changlensis TaxID=402884 RepID=UPI0040335F55